MQMDTVFIVFQQARLCSLLLCTLLHTQTHTPMCCFSFIFQVCIHWHHISTYSLDKAYCISALYRRYSDTNVFMVSSKWHIRVCLPWKIIPLFYQNTKKNLFVQSTYNCSASYSNALPVQRYCSSGCGTCLLCRKAKWMQSECLMKRQQSVGRKSGSSGLKRVLVTYYCADIYNILGCFYSTLAVSDFY